MDWVLAGDRDRHRCWDWLRSPAFGGAEVPVPVGESGYQGPGQAPRQRRGSGASPWGLGLRFGHSHWVESFGECVFGEDVLFEAQLPDRLAGLEGFLGQCGGVFVADQGVEAGAHLSLIHI